MRYSSFEKNIIQNISNAIPDVTPGVLVRAYYMGRLICDVSVGSTQPYYDLASLTKIVFTQQAMMSAFDQKLWSLDSKVIDFLPDFFDTEIKVTSLLTHTSGLDWWKPFFTELSGSLKDGWIAQRLRMYTYLNRAENKIQAEGVKAVYSDLGFLLLGYTLEKMHQKNILNVWNDLKDKHYSHTSFDFNLNNQLLYPENLYAPTEFCQYRNKTLRGEVHDENTWSMGGISTHAGLFGSIDDVASYGLMVRSQLQGIANYSIKLKTAQLFATRAIPETVGDFSLGYMMPSDISPSCGSQFSKKSIGHTGFTGTSVWYDQNTDFLVTILSNRVYYGRENKAYIQLRPQIHNWLYEAIRKLG